MIKKALVKGSAFIVILLLIITQLNNIFIKKVSHQAKLYQGLYNKENQFEVLFMGSSHMNNSANPNVLWSKY